MGNQLPNILVKLNLMNKAIGNYTKSDMEEFLCLLSFTYALSGIQKHIWSV